MKLLLSTLSMLAMAAPSLAFVQPTLQVQVSDWLVVLKQSMNCFKSSVIMSGVLLLFL
jgi:hypothetical protein